MISVCWSMYSTVTWMNFTPIVEQRNDTFVEQLFKKNTFLILSLAKDEPSCEEYNYDDDLIEHF